MINRNWQGLQYRLAKLLFVFTRPRMLSKTTNFQGLKVQGVRIGNTTFIDYPKQLKVEDHVYIGHHNYIEASNGIQLGKGCQITSFVSITTHSSHQSIRLYGSSYAKHKDHIGYIKGSVAIGDFSFVGPFTVIMPNTTIGKGSLIAAHSYVKGEFPDFSIITGNPAVVTGDVRDKDNKWLTEFQELNQTYMK